MLSVRRLFQCAQPIRQLVVGLLFVASCSVAGNQQEVQQIVLPFIKASAPSHQAYFPKLLSLALDKTVATYGPYEIHYFRNNFTSARIISELKFGRSINVLWTSPDEDRERELLPIRVSLLQGLNSHRIFLIRRKDRDTFRAIHSLDDLRRLRAGSVSNWPDTRVMQNNDLPVVTSAHYDLLFTMLAGKRFDYFPRGLYEVWDEQQAHADKGLVIEEHLMFYYPAPIYFFVNPRDKKLAERIERGLQLAIEDGSFNELFFSVPSFKRGYEELANKERRVFDLDQPPQKSLGALMLRWKADSGAHLLER
jgi:hypothetical protein